MPFGQSWPRGCQDSAGNPLRPPRLDFELTHHGPQAAPSNRLEAVYFGVLGVPATVLTALGLRLDPPGIAIPGVGCQRLFVDFGAPTWLFADTTRRSTGYGYRRSLTPAGAVVVPPGLVGVPLVLQSAWADTKTSALRLTNASFGWLPRISPFANPADLPRRAVYQFSVDGVQLSFVSADGSFNPICRYR